MNDTYEYITEKMPYGKYWQVREIHTNIVCVIRSKYVAKKYTEKYNRENKSELPSHVKKEKKYYQRFLK